MNALARVAAIYDGSDGDATKRLYSQLAAKGGAGDIAVNLFRTQKNSARAKVYSGGIRGAGSFRNMAYERKNWSLGLLCQALTKHGSNLGIAWGWKSDARTAGFEWVLYVDLEEGQVSFHSAQRGEGPEYAGEWDRQRLSQQRILMFCARVLEMQPQPLLPGMHAAVKTPKEPAYELYNLIKQLRSEA